MRKTAVFGDIHGNSDLLKKLLMNIKSEFGDIDIWSCGDLIDRGPDSKGVLDLCIENNIKTVRGNHDSWVLDLLTEQYFVPKAIRSMGGLKTIESYMVDWRSIIRDKDDIDGWASVASELLNNMPNEHISYFLNMYDVGYLNYPNKNFWIFHAGLTYENALLFDNNDGEFNMVKRFSEKEPDELVWCRPSFRRKNDNLFHFENGIQIFGHSYTELPVVREHFIALDTIGGGQEDNWTLSAVILPEIEIIQVKDS